MLARFFSLKIDFFIKSILHIFFHRQYREDESQSEEDDYRSLDASLTYKGLLMVWGYTTHKYFFIK